jgi:DNA polymerase-3 subunit delta
VIIKSYEVEKINLNKDGIVLFYGKNNGLKNEAIEILNKNKSNILSYQEKEILDNQDNFIETIISKSLFDTQKFIVIKRATDKILGIIENLQQQNLEDTTIILNSDKFGKKIKIKNFF